jgi:hypothetical protein
MSEMLGNDELEAAIGKDVLSVAEFGLSNITK